MRMGVMGFIVADIGDLLDFGEFLFPSGGLRVTDEPAVNPETGSFSGNH